MNFDKFKHDFLDTLNPLRPMNDGFEDVEHFLLLWNAYKDNRLDFQSSVHVKLRHHGLKKLSNKYLLQILFYGHEKP